MLLDDVHQPLAVEGFRRVIVAACLDAFLSIPHHGVGSQGDDRPRVVLLTEELRRLVTAHDGHLHVHQDDIEWMRLVVRRQRGVERELSVLDDRDIRARLIQHMRDEPLVVRAVLGQQDTEVVKV